MLNPISDISHESEQQLSLVNKLSEPIFNSIKNRLGFSSNATCNNSATVLLKFIIKKKGTYSLLYGICSEIQANIIIFY